ncbi:MAG TPA: hypothetical protein VHB79_05550 [Polyangiaceae bacterium]|nr:hypothetical protein [Polyangiaceae bacterium]
MRPAWLALMLLAAGAVSARARAQESHFAWRGPDCTSSAPLLERRLAELVEPQDRPRLAGSVAVTQGADRYAVEVSIDLDGRPLGTRRFEAKDCARAAETAAVAASLAVFDGQGEPQGAAESGISPDIWTRRPDPTPDFSRPRSEPPPAQEPLLRPRLGLLGLVEVAALPEPAAGGAAELELGVGQRWSLGLLGSMTAEQGRQLQATQTVSLWLRSAALRACVAPKLEARYRVDACAGASVNEARGRGEGFDENRTASLTWLAPLLGVNLSVPAPSFIEWRGELEASAPLSRRRFLVNGSEVSRASFVVVALRFGALLRF